MCNESACSRQTSFEFAVHGIKLRAELSQAERSEALLREAQPPPKAAGAEGAPELREGFKQKLEAYMIEAFKHVAYILPGSAGKRALHERDIYIYIYEATTCRLSSPDMLTQ